MNARQLVFDLPVRPALGRDDFLVAPCNREALAWIDRWPDWPQHALALAGPEGCGKTHLAHVWRASSGALLLDAATLDEASLAHLPEVAVIVEDADRRLVSERALLHLFNMQRERGGHLLLTGREAPARWEVRLPDLASRLNSLPVATVRPPDEALIGALLVKLLADRQVRVGEEVLAWLLPRMERSFAFARRLVAALDDAALSRRRNISVSLAREILQHLAPEE
ncbi:MAG: DNA replication protein [Alphaproteobacteria bacterium]|nr:DNA replication protein [Alphaproteobacteria bacterium]